MSQEKLIAASSTTPDRRSAEIIAKDLVERGLAACVQIVGPIRSVYRWKGKLEEEDEFLLLLKTQAALIPEIEKRLEEIHPYEVPELLAVPVIGGGSAYLDWIRENLRR